ncbi:MAG: formyltransferase family protein [Chitinophagaceae bacterium]
MKVVFLGATQFSRELLLHLLNNQIKPERLFTIPQEFNISYSDTKVRNYNYANLPEIAAQHGITCYEVESTTGKRISDYYDDLAALQPDVILVMGWYYMVPKKIRDIARYGTWGIHASMLPKYAGGAPLVWAIINGEKETGVSLFKLDDGVDDGDIIAQQVIPIAFEDSIQEVYAKVTEASKGILVSALQNIERIKFTPQDKSKIEVWPQRKPEDGEIDLSWPAERIYNFIRAQSPPYPGAFIKTADGKKIIIEKAKMG